MAIAMLTPNQFSIYASPTTEDDGWTEDDYEGSPEEQEEQAQEDWEDAGRPGEIEDDNDENDNENDNDNGDELIECEDGSLVDSEELSEQSELVQCVDGSYAATQAECPSAPVASQEQLQTCPDGSVIPLYDACLISPEVQYVTCPDGGDPLPDGSCPPIPCPDGGDPLPDGSCPPIPPPITCGKETHIENGKCVPNKNGNDDSKSGSSSSSSSSSASATANVIATEVSSCKIDGNAHGIQQEFDIAKYRACGFYPSGQIAYTDGFVFGCTQVGNTQQLCQAFVLLNTQPTQMTTQQQTHPSTQSTTQPTQAIQPAEVS